MSNTNLIADTLNTLAGAVHGLAREKGWYDNQESDTHFMARACSNLHGEVSEMWEALRAGELNEPCDKAELMIANNLDPLTCMEEELADIVIRALDTAERMGVNIGDAVMRKHYFNQTRPHRHGGKVA